MAVDIGWAKNVTYGTHIWTGAYPLPPIPCSESICRGCGGNVVPDHVFADLGAAPLVNALLNTPDLAEAHYPLKAMVCQSCLLVQLPQRDISQEALFPSSYPYRSGLSPEWVGHCTRFAEEVKDRLGLGPLSKVLEIGSNDGSGMARFRGLGIPVLGVEPCAEVADEALQDGFATYKEWWTEAFAKRLGKFNLIIARNVLAHVTDLPDFLRGVKHALATGGTAVFEVPYIKHLIADRRWDQIYHEHHCYFSIWSLNVALRKIGLGIADVEYVPVHGGSLRIYATTDAADKISAMGARAELLHEIEIGLTELDTYLDFAEVPGRAKRRIQRVLGELEGYDVVGYGASAKAATLLNYCGIGPEAIDCVVDVTPDKWGKYLPGSRIRVEPESYLERSQPDVVVNFCWNWKETSERFIRRDAPHARIIYL